MSDAEDWDPYDDLPDFESSRDQSVVLGQYEMGNAILLTLGGGGSPVDAAANSYEFARKYDLRVDGEQITGPTGLDGDYKHLKDWYEDEHRKQAAMAGAQTGKTARLLTHMARTAYSSAYGRLIGYYFPDKHLPGAFSNERFKPFIKSNPELAKTLGVAAGGKKGRDATLTMNLAETTLYLMTIGGKTATEGLPLKAVYFDEVRRMKLSDIERAQERYSAQKDPVDFKVSTAKYPKGDIHKFFLEGDQRYFHTECKCAEGVVLSTTFPSCVALLRNTTPQFRRKVEHAYSHAGLPFLGMSDEERAMYPEAVYLCPKCGEILVDPRLGWWEPHAPHHLMVHSYQLPQMLSIRWPAGKILHKRDHAEDMQEFHNSALGLPYVDVEKMPLQEEHVDACVDSALQWGEHMSYEVRRRKLVNCAMGIDVQAGYAICSIKARAPNGKHRTVHLEVLRNPGQGRTWWYRAAVLMKRYDVRLCVVDEAPEFNDSLLFAQQFRGRVFLANFALGDNAPRFIQWDDETLVDDKKQKGDTASRHRVSMKRTHALHWSLHRWKNRHNEIPTLGSLIQTIPLDTDGNPVFSAHLRVGTDGPASMGLLLRSQLVVWVFRDVYDDPDLTPKARNEAELRGKKRWVAEFVGGQSPDFAMADLYSSVAMDRIGVPSGIRGLG